MEKNEIRDAKFKATVMMCMIEPVVSFLAGRDASVNTLMQFGYTKEESNTLVDECIEEMYLMIREGE